MYNQPETALEHYELEVHQITKGRSSFICDTNQGMLLLYPFRGSKERAAFLIEVLEELNRNGYPVEQVLITKEGEPVAEDEGGTRYWLKSYVAGSECAAGNETDLLQAAGQLAKLHVALSRSQVKLPDFMKNDRSDPKLLYERHYKELVKLNNYVKTRKRKNEFEQMFRSWYPYYIKEAQTALEGLLESKEDNGYQLCHGDYNQHNVIKTKEGFRIIHFENLSYHLAVSDLANFLRKMMEKNGWNIELGQKLLWEYEKVRPMESAERRALYLLLVFPEKFWKVANHYGNSNKAWVSGRDIDKLRKMTEQEENRHTFLENLFSII